MAALICLKDPQVISIIQKGSSTKQCYLPHVELLRVHGLIINFACDKVPFEVMSGYLTLMRPLTNKVAYQLVIEDKMP